MGGSGVYLSPAFNWSNTVPKKIWNRLDILSYNGVRRVKNMVHIRGLLNHIFLWLNFLWQLMSLANNEQWLKLEGWRVYHLVHQQKRSMQVTLLFSSIWIELVSPSTSKQAVDSNHTESVNANNYSTSEILPAEAAAWRESLHQNIVMLHSNYYDSFISNPKMWQRSILLAWC